MNVRGVRRTDLVIALATAALACALVWWADREHARVQPWSPPSPRTGVWRPDWVWWREHLYGRLQHGWFWFGMAATVGAGALLACDRRTWTRRGLSRPGTAAVALALLIGGTTAAQLMLSPRGAGPNGLCYALRNTLEMSIAGAVLGVWTVFRLRPRRGAVDWRERVARVVGWVWLGNIALLVAYGLIFG